MTGSAVVVFGGSAQREPRVESRAARIRRTGHAKVAGSTTLSNRLGASLDYVRMAAAEARRSGVDPGPAMEQVHAMLLATGDAITAKIAGGAS